MKSIVTVLILLFAVVATAQKTTLDYFNEASDFADTEKFGKALQGFKYIVAHHPKNQLYPKALYNVGYIHFIQKRYRKAIPVFRTILESEFNEKDSFGGGIMSDPFTNYKHRASKTLSEIYDRKKKYEKALYYLAMSDTMYPYLHSCGNEYAYNQVHYALQYSSIYQKLKQPEKAIEKLLPVVFVTLTNNAAVIEELKSLLSKHEAVKQELDQSLSEMYLKTTVDEEYENTHFLFNFRGVEIIIPSYFVDNEVGVSAAILNVKESAFYKMVAELEN